MGAPQPKPTWAHQERFTQVGSGPRISSKNLSAKELHAKAERGEQLRYIHGQSKSRRKMHRDFDQFYKDHEDHYKELHRKLSWEMDPPPDMEDIQTIAWKDFQEVGGPGFGTPYKPEEVKMPKKTQKDIYDLMNRLKWI